MKKSEYKNVEIIEIAAIPGSFGGISKGVSASFVGFLDNCLVVVGGCNFPEIPAAQKGKKVFYQEIMMLQHEGWKKIGTLPQPLAYGVGISANNTLICIGGQNNDSSLSAVYQISYDKVNQKADVNELPSLPVTFDNGAGALVGSSIYIVGGNQNGTASAAVWQFDLLSKSGWLQTDSIPVKGGLVQPVALGSNQPSDSAPNRLFVAGGFSLPTENSLCEVHATLWEKNQLPHSTWSEKKVFPSNEHFVSLSGSAGATLANGQLVFVGGVNKSIFENAMNRNTYLSKAKADNDTDLVEKLLNDAAQYMHHEPDWYQFNNHLWLYNVVSDTWNDLGAYPELALAGASVAAFGNEVFVVNGEIKPGIRTPKIWKLKFSD